MKKEEIKSKIEGFHGAMRAYRDLLSKSRDAMVRIVRNGQQIEEMRSDLNRKLGALSKYIKKLGHNPYSSDIGGGPYPVYETALSNDILQRRGPCIDMALQDLDYIIGRLENMSEEEFDDIFSPRKHVEIENVVENRNGKETTTNTHKQYWGFVVSGLWGWIKDNKIISGIIVTVIGGLILSLII